MSAYDSFTIEVGVGPWRWCGDSLAVGLNHANPPNPRDRCFFVWDVIGFAWQKPQEVNKFGVHAFKTNPVIVRLVIVALRHMLLIIGTFC